MFADPAVADRVNIDSAYLCVGAGVGFVKYWCTIPPTPIFDLASDQSKLVSLQRFII